MRYRYAEPGDEAAMRFVVLESHDGRELLNPERYGFAAILAPVELVSWSDLVEAPQ